MSDRLPLAGLRVLDLSIAWAGPLAARLLSDFGAEVIKVESFQHVDFMRYQYIAEGEAGEKPWERGWWCSMNHGRYGLAIDLTKPLAVDIFLRLVAISDVVVENYSPRVMKNLGLDYPVLQRVNPRLIMISLSAYGQTGPYRNYIGYGTTIEPVAGISYLAGHPDGPPIELDSLTSDPTGGFLGAAAILAALRYRDKTGRGQYIDLSEAEGAMHLIGGEILDFTMNGRSASRSGNRHRRMAPHNCYRCSGNDEWVAIAVENDAQWQALCHAMERPDLASEARYLRERDRWQNQGLIDREIEAWTLQQSRQSVADKLRAAGVAVGPLAKNRDLFEDPQVVARRFWKVFEQPELGRRPSPDAAFKLSRTPGGVRGRAPSLGEHNKSILTDLLGLLPENVEQLYAEGILSEVPVPNLPPEVLPPPVWTERGAAEFDPDYRARLGLI